MERINNMLQLMLSAGTCLVGLMLALVWGAGTEFTVFGWLLAVLGAVGVAVWVLLPQPSRYRRR